MTVRTSTAFGALLRRYRSTANLSQEALAERAGLSVAAISALEAGRRSTPRPETVAMLATALALAPVDRQALAAAAGGYDPGAALEPTASAAHAATSRLATSALPRAPTPLIGREHEVAALTHLLHPPGRARLVTLLGPGGVGKTRLALDVAAALATAYADGAAFVDLSVVRDPQLIAPLVAQAVGVRDDGTRGVQAMLLATLREREVLLVLDNVEQVVAGAPLLADLVAACPRVAVLVTSRIALQVRAEQRVPVAPLTLPDPAHTAVTELESSPAVRLFVARAQAVRPEFQLAEPHATLVAEICRRLEGLPLALELAAARIGMLPPAALLRRLEQRLGVLTGGARDLPARQQTLRATMEWSYALLTPQEQTMLARLSVFVGAGTLEAIEAVCDPDMALGGLATVAALVDKSLAQTESEPTPRVHMLETVREYARDRLDEAAETGALHRAHAVYYATLADMADPQLRGAEQAIWLQRLADEHDNLRAALHRALQQGAADLGWRLGGALWRFWYIQGHIGEGRTWLTRLLTLSTAEETAELALARARVLAGAGVFAELQGDYPAAERLHTESLALREQHGDRWGMADSLDDLGVLADSQGDVERAAALFDQALALFADVGDAWGRALVLSNKGYLAREQGEDSMAAVLHEQSLALFRTVGDRRNIAFTLNNLGEVCCDQGDYERAAALCDESLALRRALGDRWGVAISIASLGRVAQAQGQLALARARYEESLALFRTLGATWNVACTLDSLSTLVCQQGAYAQAEDLSAESLALFQSIGDVKGSARALTTAAQVACAEGNLPRAARLCHESLALYRGLGPLFGAVVCLECLAHVLCAATGRPAPTIEVERAVQLWGAATALRDARGTRRSPDEQAAYERSLTAARAILGASVAAAWAHGATLSLAEAMELAATSEP